MWDLIVSVPDHCLSFYFVLLAFRACIVILDAVRCVIAWWSSARKQLSSCLSTRVLLYLMPSVVL